MLQGIFRRRCIFRRLCLLLGLLDLLILILSSNVGIRGRFSWSAERKLEQLGESAVMLLEQPQSAQSLNAGGRLGGIGKLPSSLGMLGDRDGGVGGLRGDRSGAGVIVCLQRSSCQFGEIR